MSKIKVASFFCDMVYHEKITKLNIGSKGDGKVAFHKTQFEFTYVNWHVKMEEWKNYRVTGVAER